MRRQPVKELPSRGVKSKVEKILALREAERRAVGLRGWKESVSRRRVEEVSRGEPPSAKPGQASSPWASVPGSQGSVLAGCTQNPIVCSRGHHHVVPEDASPHLLP